MKTWLFLLLFICSIANAAKVDFALFQRMLEDPEFQQMLASKEGKKMVASYKRGLPKTKDEFSKFQTSISYWRLKKMPAFKKFASAPAAPVEPTRAPVQRVKSEREKFLEQYMASNKKVEVAPEPTTIPEIVEEMDEDEEDMEELKAHAEQMKKLGELAKDGDVDLEKLQKAFAQDSAGTVVDGTPASLADQPDIVIARMLSGFKNQSEEKVVNDLKEASKGKIGERLYVYVPQLPLFIARTLRSEDALPSAAKMLKDKQRLLIYTLLNLATILLGYLLKRFSARGAVTASRRIKGFIGRVLILNALRIFLLVFFFKEELTPLAKIFQKTFL